MTHPFREFWIIQLMVWAGRTVIILIGLIFLTLLVTSAF